MDSSAYDVEAKSATTVTRDQTLSMLQALLAERFKLKVHRATRGQRLCTDGCEEWAEDQVSCRSGGRCERWCKRPADRQKVHASTRNVALRHLTPARPRSNGALRRL